MSKPKSFTMTNLSPIRSRPICQRAIILPRFLLAIFCLLTASACRGDTSYFLYSDPHTLTWVANVQCQGVVSSVAPYQGSAPGGFQGLIPVGAAITVTESFTLYDGDDPSLTSPGFSAEVSCVVGGNRLSAGLLVGWVTVIMMTVSQSKSIRWTIPIGSSGSREIRAPRPGYQHGRSTRTLVTLSGLLSTRYLSRWVMVRLKGR